MRNTPFFDSTAGEQTPQAIRAFLENAMNCCVRFAERMRLEAEKKKSALLA